MTARKTRDRNEKETIIHLMTVKLSIINELVRNPQVPKTCVNLDGDVREKFMFLPSILTQRSREWGVSQIFTGRIIAQWAKFQVNRFFI